MKKGFLRFIAVVMVVVMTALCAPVSDVTDLFAVEASAASYSGSLGGSVKWSYDSSSKELKISGSGTMSNYTAIPGDFTKALGLFGINGKIFEKATKITISNGVTNVGDNVFKGFKSVKSVTIPGSVTSIGTSAFANCTALTSVSIPASVTTIGTSAFEGCTSLSSVTIASGVKTINANAFKNTKASNISIPASVTSIGKDALAGISGLKITCEYGTTLYKYCLANSIKCSLPKNTLVVEVATNKDGTAKVTLKMVYNQAKFSAANYTFTYTNASLVSAAAAATPTDVLTDVVKNKTGKYSIAVMAKDYVPYSSSLGICEFKVAEFTFKLNCKNSASVFTFSADTLLINDARATIPAATVNAKLAHSYKTVTTKATLSANGTSKQVCNSCGYVGSTKTISKPSSFTLSATSYTFDDSVKAPTVTVKDSAGKTLKKDTDYTVSYASGRKAVGTYKVTVTMKGNYSGSKTLSFKINPCDVSKCTVKLSSTSYTYDGTVKGPSVTVKNAKGTTLKSGTDYTVTYASGRKAPGTYKVTVTMKGNYTGTKTLTFKINPIDVSKCTVKLSSTSYTYDGKVKTPSVTVKDAKGKTLKSGTDYTVSYASGRKTVGAYKVTVKMKGNYTGSKVLTFNILPGKTSKITVTPTTTTLKATWTKVTGATGYKVELLNANGKVVKSATTTSLTYTFSKLSAGTTYKVKVTAYKTISGKNTYSTVSTTLATATKVATPTLKVTSSSKGTANFTWTNVAGENGYEVYYSTSSSSGFKSAASYKTDVAKGSKSKLTSGKTYYFKVRAFKTVGGKKVYGDWSKVVSVKVK